MGLEEGDLEEQGAVTWEDRLKKFVQFDDKNLFNNLPLVLFIALLGVLHVANSHTAENKIRRMNSLDQDVKELRWMYMTTKAELMFKSKQSEVAKMVEKMGLKELSKPPYKIEVDKDEYE
jgi:H+/gluconate symporter-like permease